LTTEELNEALKEELKSYLNVTWNDEDNDIKKIVIRGQSYLNGKAGVSLDFENDHEAIQLLLDYGRYVRNHSFEMFEANFFNELFSLSLREGVKDHATVDETNTETST
jgi:hypothetical protein